MFKQFGITFASPPPSLLKAKDILAHGVVERAECPVCKQHAPIHRLPGWAGIWTFVFHFLESEGDNKPYKPSQGSGKVVVLEDLAKRIRPCSECFGVGEVYTDSASCVRCGGTGVEKEGSK